MQTKSLQQMKRVLHTALFFLLIMAMGTMNGYAWTSREIIGDIIYELNHNDSTATVVGHVDGAGATGTITILESIHYGGDVYTVTSIGGLAFSNCSGLTGDLIIPNSITDIGWHAFSGCSGFTGNLIIPNSVTTIADNVFSGCSGFTGNLIIGNSVTDIGRGAFSGCSGFSGDLIIPNSVTIIRDNAFRNCSGFTGSLIIGNSVTYIYNEAFLGCSGFSGSLIIGTAVTWIGFGAFYLCSGFTGNLIIPDSVTAIYTLTFAGCSGFSGSLTIGNSVALIGSHAFNDCGFTGDLIIPNSVTTIEDYAFSSCSGFTGNLIIPNSVTTIADYAFSGCSGFAGNLVIGNSVTEIGREAFSGCSGFTGVAFNAVNCADANNSYPPFQGCGGSLVVGENVERIPANMFYGCSGFTGDLIIPNSVTSIGEYAFFGCSGFTGNLIISNSVTTIEDCVFCGCSGFTGNLIIPNQVTSIGNSAFGNCSGFSEVDFNAINCADAHSYYPPFTGCGGSLVIGGSVQRIPAYMFYDCVGFTGGLTIPNSVTSIGVWAFGRCSGFTGNLTIGNSVSSIGYAAFYECSGFTDSLTLPNSVTMIGDYAFGGCSGFMGSLTISNSMTSISNYAFRGCSGFTGSITIPNSVSYIGEAAFYGCSGFTDSLSVSNSVTTISNYAFGNCCGISSLHAHSTQPPVTESNAFSGINSDIPVYVPCGSMEAYSGAKGWNRFVNYHDDCIYTITVLANPSESGDVSGGGEYGTNDICALEATAHTGFTFINWSEDNEVVSFDAEYSFSVHEDAEYTANFSGGSIPYFSISASADPIEGGLVSGNGYYLMGQICTLSASSNDYYDFLYWTRNGVVVSTQSNYSFPVTEDASFVAHFQTVTINPVSNPIEGGDITIGKMQITESFEDYTVGNNIASEALAIEHAWWTTWNDAPGSEEDGIVAALNGNQCGYISNNNDQVLLLSDKTSGVYNLEFDILVPEGKCGYFNILHDFAGSNSKWAMQCFLHASNGGGSNTEFNPGHGTIHAGSNSTAIIDCVYDEWMHFRMFVDIDTDVARYYYTLPGETETLVCEWQWSLDSFGNNVVGGTLSAMDFFPPMDASISEFYLDNFIFEQVGDNHFHQGEICTLSTKANQGYRFMNWTEDGIVVSEDARYSFVVTGNRTLVANFAVERYKVVATANPEEGGAITGTGYYYYGETATLTATANDGYAFVNWTKEGEEVSSEATYSFTVTEAASFVANYESSTITQTTNLSRGWNWYSTYIEQDGINGLGQLENSIGVPKAIIQSQGDGYVKSILRNGRVLWGGALNSINNEEMYKIGTKYVCTATMEGIVADPASHPITINKGWNWIGFPCSESVSVSEAFSGFTPRNKDVIKGLNSYATYRNGAWVGTLNTLEPGQGYMYGSGSNAPKTLVFQSGNRGEASLANITPANNYYQPVADYADNMTLTAVIELDGEELRSEDYELAAFVGDECRGSVKLMYVEPLNRYIAFLTVFGDETEDLYFVLTDGTDMSQSEDFVRYETDGMVGSLGEPVTLRFGTTDVNENASANVRVYPNPSEGIFNVEGIGIRRIEVANVYGQVILSKDVEDYSSQIDLGNNAAGIYMLRVVTDDGIATRQIVKK